MGIKEIEALIRFHKGALSEHRQFMSVTAVYLEQQTIKALEELKEKIDGN